MPGKLCNNNRTLRTPLPLRAQAFCDGRKAQKDGELKSTNPWNGVADDDQNKENELDWDAGWDSANAGDDRGCCAQ